MKTIEKVANAILDKAMEIADRDEYSCISSARGKSDMDMGLALAQVAIEALDIIILPKDAEPEVGDVMVFYGDHDDPDQYEAHVVCATTNWDYFNCYQHNKIIKRNGKLAIQEPKEGA